MTGLRWRKERGFYTLFQREGWTLDRGKDTGLTNKIPTSLIDYLLPRLSRKRTTIGTSSQGD